MEIHGYCESFNGKLRDELLNREVFYSLKEVQILTEKWRREYNEIRPHSSLGYRPPAPEAILHTLTMAAAPSRVLERFCTAAGDCHAPKTSW